MNPDAPRTPREELEIQITALLMGQLSPEEAAIVEAQVAADPELTALRERLQQAANLLREARALPDAVPSGETMRLSQDRREKLLATFRGIKALPSAQPAPARAPLPIPRRKLGWKTPMILAASIAALLAVSPFFVGERLARHAPYAPSGRPDHSLMELSRDADYAPPSPHISLRPERSRTTVTLSDQSRRYAMNGSSQSGAISTPGETPATPNLTVSSTGSSRLSLGSGHTVPQTRGLKTAQPPVAAAGGVYLPRTDAADEPSVKFLADARANGAGLSDLSTAFGNNRLESKPAERFDTFSDSPKLDAKSVEGRVATNAPANSGQMLGRGEQEIRSRGFAREESRGDGAAISGPPEDAGGAAPLGMVADRENLQSAASKRAGDETQQWDATSYWSRPLAESKKQAGASAWSLQGVPAAPDPSDFSVAQGLPAGGRKPNADANARSGNRAGDDLSAVAATATRAKAQASVPATAPADPAALAPEDVSLQFSFKPEGPKVAGGKVPDPPSGEFDFDSGLARKADGTALADPQQAADVYATAPKPQAATAAGVDPAQQQFVEAFLAVRKAEEKAAAGDVQAARHGFETAAKSLEQIKQQWPNWQPELLHYRLKRTQQAIRDIEAKVPAKEGETTKPAAAAGEPPTPVAAPVPPPVPQPEVATAENAFSTFSLNVSDVSYQLAAASLDKGQMPDAGAIRSEEFINAFNYRDPEPAKGSPFAFASERARYPFAHNRDLLRVSLKTAAVGREAARALNLVLVIDNSGSMERADRVTIMKEALRVLAAQLKPQDKLSLITFSRSPRLWADGVAGDKAAQYTQRVGEMTPEGGTDLSAALDLGYETALKHYGVGSLNRVVLLTDGAANLGDVKADALKAKVEKHRRQGVAFDCFGVGWEGYNDDLLEQLSRNGDGRYGFINSVEAAAKDFAGQLAGALRPAASDVKVQVEFNPRRVLNYRQIGYARHQLTKEQVRDNTVDAAELAAAESGNALYTVEVNPRGEGDIATVRARFKVPGTADYQEHAWSVPYRAPAPALEQSSSSLRLAATAAAFSEILAQSPHAAEITSDRLLQLISGIPAIYGADSRPAKLEAMIRQAKSLSGR